MQLDEIAAAIRLSVQVTRRIIHDHEMLTLEVREQMLRVAAKEISQRKREQFEALKNIEETES